MQKALGVILSVASVFMSFACTGQSGAGDAGERGGGSNGGSSGADGGGSVGGSSGASSGGIGGSSVGGSGGSSAGGSSGASGGNAGSSAGGSSGATAGGSGGMSGGAGSGGNGGSDAGRGGDGGGGMGGNANGGSVGGGGGPTVPSVLVFSKTTGYRHESIPAGVAALTSMASDRGWSLQATEDASRFSDSGLAPFNVLVFLSPSGDVFNADQQAAFERYIRAGHGYVGIHAASTAEYDWPFYGELVGAFFREHPDVQPAVIRVENANHPSTVGLPSEWRRTDEWYSFRANPRPDVTVLLTLDESSYSPGTSTMGADHPIAWFHEYEGSRSFYTALGHGDESFAEPAFLGHIRGAIEWAAGR